MPYCVPSIPCQGKSPASIVRYPYELLSQNWKKEFTKWLGKDRVGVFVGDKDKTVIKQFVNSSVIRHLTSIIYTHYKGVGKSTRFLLSAMNVSRASCKSISVFV